MTIQEIARRINGEIVVDTKLEINDFYVGDFLSRVMGKAPSDSAWLTIMNNINVAGVAVMAEIHIIILCEGVEATTELKEKCIAEDIGVVTTAMSVFECCSDLSK